jgi:hypothetical protein
MGCIYFNNKEKNKTKTITYEDLDELEELIKNEQVIFEEFIEEFKSNDSLGKSEDVLYKIRVSVQINYLQDQIFRFKNSCKYNIGNNYQKYMKSINPLIKKYNEILVDNFKNEHLIFEFEKNVQNFLFYNKRNRIYLE